MTMRLFFVIVFLLNAAIAQNAGTTGDLGKTRISEVLSLLRRFHTSPPPKGIVRENLLAALRDNPDWPDVLWPRLVDLTRLAKLTGADSTKIRALGTPQEFQKRRVSASEALIEIQQILDLLATVRSDDSVRLIAPLLMADGIDLGNGDALEPPVSNRALSALTGIYIADGTNIYPLKGKPPGADRMGELVDIYRRSNRGEYVVFPSIQMTMDDWRNWWSATASEYGKVFALPADLCVPPKKPAPDQSKEKPNSPPAKPAESPSGK